MSERIYAISLWQPWASLIFARVDGEPVKVHETRHWVPSEPGMVKRGSRIIIHAAKTTRGYRDMSPELHDICAAVFGAPMVLPPTGVALGTVELVDWYPADPRRAASEMDLAAGGWGENRYAWRLANPVAFQTPVPMKGRQSFWRVDRSELGGLVG